MGDVTVLLGAMSRGDAAARDRLFGLVYGELMGLARGHLSRAGTGAEKVGSFTIPAAAPFGNGSYVVEIAGSGGTTGTHDVRLTSP